MFVNRMLDRMSGAIHQGAVELHDAENRWFLRIAAESQFHEKIAGLKEQAARNRTLRTHSPQQPDRALAVSAGAVDCSHAIPPSTNPRLHRAA